MIRPLAEPFKAAAGIAVLRGNLAPDGAVIKPSAASPQLLTHRGRAVVFESIEDFKARIDDESLDIDETCVMVLKNCGPRGYPGMAEVGNMPLPPKLLRRGITDMVRISDARMSGTAYGTVVLHVSPEAAAGGPLALVRDGDFIELDVPGRRLHLDVPDGGTGPPPRRVAARRLRRRAAGPSCTWTMCSRRIWAPTWTSWSAAAAATSRASRTSQACRRYVDFGRLADGRRVEAITLGAPAGLQAEVLTYGAILRRLSVPGGRPASRTRPRARYAWSSTITTPPTSVRWSAASRTASRRDASPSTASHHQLTRNENGNHLHGGAAGIGRRLWQVLDASADTLTLGLHSPAGEEGYPGNLDITLGTVGAAGCVAHRLHGAR